MYSCERAHICVCIMQFTYAGRELFTVFILETHTRTAACDITSSLQSLNIMQRARAGKMTNI